MNIEGDSLITVVEVFIALILFGLTILGVLYKIFSVDFQVGRHEKKFGELEEEIEKKCSCLEIEGVKETINDSQAVATQRYERIIQAEGRIDSLDNNFTILIKTLEKLDSDIANNIRHSREELRTEIKDSIDIMREDIREMKKALL